MTKRNSRIDTPSQYRSIRHTLLAWWYSPIGIEIQSGRPNKSRMHVTYWIHPDMNCNRFHILTVIACVCGYLIEDVCFSPLPLSVALFLTIPSLLFSLSTSRLRTSLFDVKEDAFFCDRGSRGSPAMQCILKVVYILCTYAFTQWDPYVIQNTPELKTQPLNRTHFPPKCIHFQLVNTSLTFCPIGGAVPLYLYNCLSVSFPINGHTISLCLSLKHTHVHTHNPRSISLRRTSTGRVYSTWCFPNRML